MTVWPMERKLTHIWPIRCSKILMVMAWLTALRCDMVLIRCPRIQTALLMRSIRSNKPFLRIVLYSVKWILPTVRMKCLSLSQPMEMQSEGWTSQKAVIPYLLKTMRKSAVLPIWIFPIPVILILFVLPMQSRMLIAATLLTNTQSLKICRESSAFVCSNILMRSAWCSHSIHSMILKTIPSTQMWTTAEHTVWWTWKCGSICLIWNLMKFKFLLKYLNRRIIHRDSIYREQVLIL